MNRKFCGATSCGLLPKTFWKWAESLWSELWTLVVASDTNTVGLDESKGWRFAHSHKRNQKRLGVYNLFVSNLGESEHLYVPFFSFLLPETSERIVTPNQLTSKQYRVRKSSEYISLHHSIFLFPVSLCRRCPCWAPFSPQTWSSWLSGVALGWLWWLEQKHPCLLPRIQPDLEDSCTPPHLYECPWHLRESHGRQEVVSKPGLREGSPQSTMLSSDCLVFRRHWAISRKVSPQIVARFFPNIISYSSGSSLAALFLCLSSPRPHYFLSCSRIPHSELILTASITLWPPVVRVAG